MEDAERLLEGWRPEVGGELSLARLIDFAFDYRGNVTVVKTDGAEIEGYLFNRNAEASRPFVQLFDLTGAGPVDIFYVEIRTVKFTGKDTAAGNSYAARSRGERPGPDGRPVAPAGRSA